MKNLMNLKDKKLIEETKDMICYDIVYNHPEMVERILYYKRLKEAK